MSTKSGENFTCLIDKDDLPKVIKYCWHLSYSVVNDTWNAEATVYLGMDENKKSVSKTVYLNRLIMNVEDDENCFVDHKNYDTLDNRKCNLRKSTIAENSRNRSGKNKNNTSGYRNVSWSEGYKKWVVQLQVNGKNKILGKFDDVHEAGKFAEEMRKIYYKEYAGVS